MQGWHFSRSALGLAYPLQLSLGQTLPAVNNASKTVPSVGRIASLTPRHIKLIVWRSVQQK
jgi:hypothetical protein